MSDVKTKRILAIVFTGVGVLASSFALWSFSVTRSFVAAAIPTIGTIVGYEKQEQFDRKNDRSNRYLYAPRIRFVTGDRRTIDFTSRQATNTRGEVGVPVDVLYSPLDPRHAELDDFGIWMTAVFLGGFGACFLAVGIAFAIAAYRASSG